MGVVYIGLGEGSRRKERENFGKEIMGEKIGKRGRGGGGDKRKRREEK